LVQPSPPLLGLHVAFATFAKLIDRSHLLSPSGQSLKLGAPNHKQPKIAHVPRRLKVTFEALM
jgi:hypothetical protein